MGFDRFLHLKKSGGFSKRVKRVAGKKNGIRLVEVFLFFMWVSS